MTGQFLDTDDHNARPSIEKTFSLSRMRFGERVREMRELLGLPDTNT